MEFHVYTLKSFHKSLFLKEGISYTFYHKIESYMIDVSKVGLR